jgi:hypothetical protein
MYKLEHTELLFSRRETWILTLTEEEAEGVLQEGAEEDIWA